MTPEVVRKFLALGASVNVDRGADEESGCAVLEIGHPGPHPLEGAIFFSLHALGAPPFFLRVSCLLRF